LKIPLTSFPQVLPNLFPGSSLHPTSVIKSTTNLISVSKVSTNEFLTEEQRKEILSNIQNVSIAEKTVLVVNVKQDGEKQLLKSVLQVAQKKSLRVDLQQLQTSLANIHPLARVLTLPSVILEKHFFCVSR